MKSLIKIKMALVFFAFSSFTFAQNLVKDLNPGPNPASSAPGIYKSFNGDFYFFATRNVGTAFVTQLWKSDGSTANTTLVKDDLTGATNIGNTAVMRTVTSTHLYFTVFENPNCNICGVELWKTDGTSNGTEIVTVLEFENALNGGHGSEPDNFITYNDEVYFIFAKNNGSELWKTDGSASGTFEVTDLLTGFSFGNNPNSGVPYQDMIVFGNKIYFSGTNTIVGNNELFASDGTATGTILIHEIPGDPLQLKPEGFFIFNEELFFTADDGTSVPCLFKTNGSILTQLTAAVNTGSKLIFQDKLFFIGGADLWSTDGTVENTNIFKANMASAFLGANSLFLFTSHIQFVPTPPYYIYSYWRTDGTLEGTSEVSENLANKASFTVLNDKMYTVLLNQGGFYTSMRSFDGFDVDSLFTGYIGEPFVFEDNIYFSFYEGAVGYELYSLFPQTFNNIEVKSNSSVKVYPNPSVGIVNIELEKTNEEFDLSICNSLGQEIIHVQNQKSVDLSGAEKGVYFINVISSTIKSKIKLILH